MSHKPLFVTTAGLLGLGVSAAFKILQVFFTATQMTAPEVNSITGTISIWMHERKLSVFSTKICQIGTSPKPSSP